MEKRKSLGLALQKERAQKAKRRSSVCLKFLQIRLGTDNRELNEVFLYSTAAAARLVILEVVKLDLCRISKL